MSITSGTMAYRRKILLRYPSKKITDTETSLSLRKTRKQGKLELRPCMCFRYVCKGHNAIIQSTEKKRKNDNLNIS
jgi:hypothetical protein